MKTIVEKSKPIEETPEEKVIEPKEPITETEVVKDMPRADDEVYAFATEDEDEKEMLSDLEKLKAVFKDFQESEASISETNKKIEKAKEEAQQIDQEKAETLARLKEMKEKVRNACAKFEEMTKANRRTVESKLEEIDQMKNKTNDNVSAINSFNSQIEKMTAALSVASVNENKEVDKVVKEEQVAVPTEPVRNASPSPEPNVNRNEEAHRIIENPSAFTLSEMREVLHSLDNATKSNIFTKEPNDPLTSVKYNYEVHEPASKFGAPTSEYDSAFSHSTISNYELDEADRIIKDTDNATLSELKWAQEIMTQADRYTSPDTASRAR